ncbi:putative ATP-dependent helicase HRQ1 [Symbiodinium microadriaticum]|uniref:Putative ATP-dependent helicase HRQ1 n=1 Tax=Symbiodinium microadriaticum TaxID=2951 RepID=A0A1Q9DJU7_SYMMI|nr:putative ATP-dependent helicase HRQ1 [Symbiodinium microadriaticum]
MDTSLPAELPSILDAEACCGACLLQLNDAAVDGVAEASASVASRCSERLRLRAKVAAALEGCLHLFHLRCIQVWAGVENSCPQCRLRFRRFGEYSLVSGQRRRICEVQHRDQVGDSSGESEITCDVCGGAGQAELLLLCDGWRGRCPGACHTFCDGLGRTVPSGRWFCPACRSRQHAGTPRPAPKERPGQGKGRGKSRHARQAEALLSAHFQQAMSSADSRSGVTAAVAESESSETRPTKRPQASPMQVDLKRDPTEAISTQSIKLEVNAPTLAAAAERVPSRHPAEPGLLELGGFLPEETPPPHAFAKLNPSHAPIDLDSDEAPEAPPPPRRPYSILQLPSEFEACAEQLRKFASTYFLCERSMPLAARTAERMWQLSQVGDCQRGLADDIETRYRQLLHVARDSFELFWQSALDPADDDPCGLRCLRKKEQPLLCVRYKGRRGKRGRIRPSDIVRCELQCRRRLLEVLDGGCGPGSRLPLCELPPREGEIQSLPRAAQLQGDNVPPARAAVAVDRLPGTAGTAKPQLDGMNLLESLKAEPWYVGQAVHVAQVGSRAANFAYPKAQLHPLLKEVLRGVLQDAASDGLKLYSHQADAIDAIMIQNKDVVISTSTGSGKSLVYVVAIFEALLREENATAFLIFPTKALAQDQLRSLSSVAQGLSQRGVAPERLTIACLDGDTPSAERNRVRREARVVLTNPDMLHSHVLPQHVEYARLLQNARYIVLDEVHIYRGAFGAHVCSIIRRLRRLVDEASLRFVACSATVANPGEHAQRLFGPGRNDVAVVARDASPSGGHVYVLWNPASLVKGPAVAKHQEAESSPPASKRMRTETTASLDAVQIGDGEEMVLGNYNQSLASPIVEVTRLLAWLVSRDVSVLAFCKWRSLVEIVLQDVKDALNASEAPQLSSRVVSYRAGYPAHLRRQLERDIFSRQVLGVACTNALELGIDIGRLDCTISLGFPGSVASLRQQFGRAGRAGHPGISFFVGFEDPVDQHFMNRPRELLARRPESVAVAPSNPAVLRGHLPCIASERKIKAEDARFWHEGDENSAWQTAVRKCIADGDLEEQREDSGLALVPTRRWATRPGGPHRAVSIRAVEDHFEVVEEVASQEAPVHEEGGFLQEQSRSSLAAGTVTAFRKLDEIDISKAFYSLHPGAVYRYRGSEYFVTNLDLKRRRATVKKCETPLAYYTRAFDHTEIRIHTREKHATSGPAKLFLGRVEMESRVKSFKRFWKSQDVQQDPEVELSLPSWGYCTRGLWFEDPVGIARRPAALKREAEASSESAQSGEQWQWGCGWAGAHAAMHALLHVIPLFVLADRRDLDAACVDEHETPPMDHPRLMIFDAKDEGLGLCDAAFCHGFAMLREARRLVEDCPCQHGCPSCIIDPHCREYNRFLSKRGALEWLQGLEAGNPTTGNAATTLPENFHAAVSAFEGAGMEPSKSEQVLRVQVEATLNHEQSYELLKLLHMLEDLDDIGEIHHNAVLADDVELKLSNYGVPLAYKSAYKK